MQCEFVTPKTGVYMFNYSTAEPFWEGDTEIKLQKTNTDHAYVYPCIYRWNDEFDLHGKP